MGSVTETCGYVSDVGFMIVVNASSFVTALIVYLLYRKGVVAEGGIVQSSAIIALSTGMLVSREEAASALPAEILVVNPVLLFYRRNWRIARNWAVNWLAA